MPKYGGSQNASGSGVRSPKQVDRPNPGTATPTEKSQGAKTTAGPTGSNPKNGSY